MRYFLLATTCAILVAAQTTINGGRTVTGPWDATGAVSTRPAKTGTGLPGTCSSGEMFFNTSSAAGQNLFLCQPDNTWTQLSGAAGGMRADQSNTFAAGTTQTFNGALDASAGTATWPVQTGGTLPASCTAGQMFLKSGSAPSRMLYVCSAANTWTQSAYAQGTTAQMPSTCSIGETYFATDATPAGQNLYLCTSANSWTRAGVAASGAANQIAYFSDASALTSDNKVTRDSSGNLTITGALTVGGSVVGTNGRFYRIYPSGGAQTAACTAGAVTLSDYSVYRLNLNNQSSCTITFPTLTYTNQIMWLLMCNGSATATTSLTWITARGGMAAGGTTGQCAAQQFIGDNANAVWRAVGPGSSWN